MKVAINFFIRMFCALLPCAGLLSVGCTEGTFGDDQNTGQNESQEKPELQVPVTISLDKVTATTVTFVGHLNVSASDLSFSQVTVCYSDTETLNVNTAERVSVTSFDKDHNFTITLTNLKYNTKYNYCIVVEVNSEKTYSEVLSVTTVNVAIDNLMVAAYSFDADISGVVSGFSPEDREYITVGVVYSTDMSDVESGEGTKTNVEDIAADGSFVLSLSGLSYKAKYYYRTYLLHNGNYSYGKCSEFTTFQHPYDATYDLNLLSASDLSASASANCYIVSQKGLYKFRTVRGNSTESVGDVNSASILWETFGTLSVPDYCDLIKEFSYKDGYIAFQTADAFKEGNAVIAAKDVSGKILWSWHIWFTDQPQGQVYYNNAGTMMDRNLGATSADPGDIGALGLFYQWGRKDPFLGSCSILENFEANSTITWPSAVKSSSITETIPYAIANPTTFITYNTINYDWDYTGSASTDNTRWTESSSPKSIYDPCPAGWRVPDGGSTGVWSKALDSGSESSGFPYDNNNGGINFSGRFGSASNIWYPASGCRYYNGGRLYYVREEGNYWSASPDHNIAQCLLFGCDGSVKPSNHTSRAFGLSVRCVQE